MNVGCFVLSLQIVQNSQNQSSSLNVSVKLFLSDEIEEWQDEDGPKVLYIEHHLPPNLFAEIFDAQIVGWQFSYFKRHLVVTQENLFVTILVG